MKNAMPHSIKWLSRWEDLMLSILSFNRKGMSRLKKQDFKTNKKDYYACV